MWLLRRRAQRLGGPPDEVLTNGVYWGLLGAIVGARLGYVIGHFSEVTDAGRDLLGVFRIWEGGISLLAGITGGVLFAIPYMRRKGLSFWPTMDLVAPGLALGIAVGRVGDLIIGDHIGDPSSAPLAWRCLGEMNGAPPLPAASYHAAVAHGGAPASGCYALPLHQTALYDLVSTLLLFLVLLFLGRSARNSGFLTLVFTTWYAAVRLVTDFLREDKRYFGLTASQITALIVLLASLYLLTRYRGAPPRSMEPNDGEGSGLVSQE
ncbi:prolipoprotein diacylglyceryl transferase [soil metagenome]